MEKKEKFKVKVAKTIVNLVSVLKKPLKLVVLSFILLAFFSHSTVAKKIVIINENVSIDNSNPSIFKEENSSSNSKSPSQSAYLVDSEGFIMVTPDMDLDKIRNEKITRNKQVSDNATTNPSQNSKSAYRFTENISDSSLLSQRSVDSCKEIITQTLSKIPSEQYMGLTTIELIYNKNSKRGGANASKISIRCNDISDSELKAVFIHELGHIVDGSFLTGKSNKNSSFVDLGTPVKSDDESVDFYSISWKNNENKVAGSMNADFCSLYGATDPYEDFAECYIFYVLQPSQFEKNALKNEILQKKLTFIKEKVFAGTKILETSKLFAKSQVYDNTKLSHSF
ncbi:MAG: hypothetical protein RBS56_04635 [Candidatus Gracilibacteria bacterium]|jgi:hypothetical protein|nr:hypothetical protein [Candidatus Gracilibacteria bacterium]